MQQLYASIGRKQLALHEKEEAKMSNLYISALQEALTSSVRRKQDLFVQESEKMLKVGQSLLSNSLESLFVRVQGPEIVQPVLQLMWSPRLGACSLVVDEAEDPRVVETLLRGIQDLVFLTGAVALATEKNALLSVLLNYSSLEHKVRI